MNIKIFNIRNILLIMIIVMSVAKISLINEGFFAFSDENRYRASGQILKSLAHGDVHSAIEFLFSTKGRPGDALLKIVPAVLQYANSEIFGLEVYEPANSWPVFAYNFIIYLLILVVHYRVSVHYLKDRALALFSVLVLCSMVIFYISLRHADPYDASLLILYFLFYKMISQGENIVFTNGKMFCFGLLAFFGYLCYPGYIMLFTAIPVIYFLQKISRENIPAVIRQLLFFAMGTAICLGIFEGISRTIGQSYVGNALTLSGTVNQGSYEECFTFLFKYLYEAEMFAGILLITGIIGFSCIFLYHIRSVIRRSASNLYIVFFVLTGIFIAYTLLGFYFHKVVWMARLLRQFMPFIILFTVFVLAKGIRNITIRNYSMALISVALCISFFIRLTEYKSYVYPKDVAWEYYNQYRFKTASLVFEYNKSTSYLPNFDIVKKKMPDESAPSLLFVNISGFFPFSSLKDYKPYSNPAKLLFSRQGCLNFKAYQFEGYDIQARENLDIAKLSIKVYLKQERDY
jgi:hypothetical protein